MCGHKRNSDPPVPSEEVISALSEVIRKRQARCQHFSLYMREDSFQSLFGEMTGSFDNLLSLKLDIVGIDDRYADLSAFLRHPFPQLRRLEVERPRFPCSILKQSLHLTHADIHKLILSSTAIADLLSWLKRATALRTFRIGLMEMPYPQPALEVPSAIGDNSIHLPNLEVFNVNTYTGSSNTVLEHLLSSISIPITCSLSITALDGERLAVLFGRAYGHLAPVALDLTPNEGRTRGYDRSTSASTAEMADVYNRSMPWIHISRYGGGECLIKAWEWGWSFACLRVLHVGDLHNAEQGTAKRFWSFLAESAVALEVLCITSFCVSRIGVDEFLDSLRGSQAMGNIDSQQVPWPALRELHSPLPSDYKYEYKRANRNESTPQLHTHFEYAFALVDALKEREMSTTGSGSGGKQLDVLRFTQYFEEPLDPEVTRILRGGAAKILGAAQLRRTLVPISQAHPSGGFPDDSRDIAKRFWTFLAESAIALEHLHCDSARVLRAVCRTARWPGVATACITQENISYPPARLNAKLPPTPSRFGLLTPRTQIGPCVGLEAFSVAGSEGHGLTMVAERGIETKTEIPQPHHHPRIQEGTEDSRSSRSG
ncbi:hypothetical protein NMY22_g3085 [Coprinellus aureogranulatus]|nr:hypothetical protein NMY22_g3085 [Coprinellus aureogranulatus]